MRKLQAGELSRLQSVQAQAMNDVCNITQRTFVSGAYSDDETFTTTVISGVPCGIKFTNGQLTSHGQVVLLDYDVVIRLSSAQPVGIDDLIDLVEKGTTVVSGTFIPYDSPTVNSSVQHVRLKRKIA